MARKLTFTPKGWDDFNYWMHDKDVFEKLKGLLQECQRTPTEGTGKPHRLTGNLNGCWARKVTSKDRVVYSFDNDAVTIYACKGHYDDH